MDFIKNINFYILSYWNDNKFENKGKLKVLHKTKCSIWKPCAFVKFDKNHQF